MDRGKFPLIGEDLRYFFYGPLATEEEVRALHAGGSFGGYRPDWATVLNEEGEEPIEIVDLAEEGAES